ncbi:MAG: pentapeptide repeat-containing protein, partial [Xenococcaceae cyanobacterium]
GARFFYGSSETASPRSRSATPNYTTGEYTGAVLEKADFSNVKRLSEEQRCYICAWGGEKTRDTVPGGCGDIPNKLGR